MQSDRQATYGRRQNPMLTAAFHTGRRPANYGKKYPPEFYTHDEIARVMRCCGRGPGAYRNRALIAVMWRSGLRISEALALQLKDIDFELGAITVPHGKGDQRRMVHLDQQTAALLELWITGPRARLNLARGAPVFCTYERDRMGLPLRPSYVRDALQRAGRRAGIEKRMHPHGLRHSCLFDLLQEGVDVVTIQLVAGHKDLGTTQRYLNHRFPIQMIRQLQQRPWPLATDDDENGHRTAAELRTN